MGLEVETKLLKLTKHTRNSSSLKLLNLSSESRERSPEPPKHLNGAAKLHEFHPALAAERRPPTAEAAEMKEEREPLCQSHGFELASVAMTVRISCVERPVAAKAPS